MRRIYATVFYRTTPEAPLAEDLLFVVDWETKRLVGQVAMHLDNDGHVSAVSGVRSHGARGLAVVGDELYVAGSSNRISIYALTESLPTFVRSFVVPGAQHVHQIRLHDGRLYVVSAGTDELYILDSGTDCVIDVRQLGPPPAPPVLPYSEKRLGEGRLHFNSIGWNAAGEALHVYMGCRTIYNRTRRTPVSGSPMRCLHDVVEWNGLLVTNSSSDGATVAIEPDGTYRILHHAPRQRSPLGGGWARGLVIANGNLICGAAPLMLTEVSQESGVFEVVAQHSFLSTPEAAVYDLALDPRDWPCEEAR